MRPVHTSQQPLNTGMDTPEKLAGHVQMKAEQALNCSDDAERRQQPSFPPGDSPVVVY
jgi:hypothetical protein